MPVQVSPEANVRVVAEKGKPTVVNPETARSVEAYRETVKEKGPRSAMEQAILRKEQVDEKTARRNIAENIGATLPSSGTGVKALDPAEQVRFDNATKAEDGTLKFLHEGKGYDNLNGTEQEAMRNALATEIRSWPGGNDLFVGKTIAETEAFLEGWAKDPALFDKIKGLHASRVVNPEGNVGSITNEHSQKIDAKEKQIEDKEKEILKNQNEQKKQYKIIESFEDRTGTGGGKGSSVDRLKEITGELETNFNTTNLSQLRREKAKAEQDIKYLTDRIKAENSVPKGVEPDRVELGRLRELLNTATTRTRESSDKLLQYEDLSKEKGDLESLRDTAKQKYEQLTEEHIEKTNDFIKLQDELFIARAELGMVASDRAEAEENFVKSIEGIYGDALNELWTERMRVLEVGLDEKNREELANPNTDPMRKAFLEGVGMIGYKVEVKGGRFRGAKTLEKKIDKDQTGKYIDEIKKGTIAPQDLVEDVFNKAKKTDGSSYTATEITNWFSAHPELASKSAQDAMEQLVIAGLQSRKVNQKDIDGFVKSGILNEEKLVDTILNSNDVQEKLEKTGFTKKAWQELKKHKKISLGLLTILLLGAPGVLLVGGYSATQLIRGSKERSG